MPYTPISRKNLHMWTYYSPCLVFSSYASYLLSSHFHFQTLFSFPNVYILKTQRVRHAKANRRQPGFGFGSSYCSSSETLCSSVAGSPGDGWSRSWTQLGGPVLTSWQVKLLRWRTVAPTRTETLSFNWCTVSVHMLWLGNAWCNFYPG